MEFVGSRAIKTGSKVLLEVEALKAELGCSIGAKSGLFDVPKVIHLDRRLGRLETEYIESLVTLQDLAVSRDPHIPSLLERTGRALAVIHEQLFLPDSLKQPLSPVWMGRSTDNVFIHGDFVTINVGWVEATDRLIIMDWSAAPVTGKKATYGSRYFDILWFVDRLFHGVPRSRLFDWNAEEMAEVFLRGYAEQAAVKSFDEIKRYIVSIQRLQWEYTAHLAKRNRFLRASAHVAVEVLMRGRRKRFLLDQGSQQREQTRSTAHLDGAPRC